MKNYQVNNFPVIADSSVGLYYQVAIRERMFPGKASEMFGLMGDAPEQYKPGRVVNEYQIHYITDGSGVYEDTSGNYLVRPGSLVINKPGAWHRYCPCPDQGWVENYLGFTWPLAEYLLEQLLHVHQKPVFDLGIREDLLDTYHQIFELSTSSDQGVDQYVTGMVLKLFGTIMTSSEPEIKSSDQRIENIIQQTCFFIKQNVAKQIDFKQIAFENNLGYEHFRKIFKQIIGMPPGQYHLDQKVRSAKKLLLSTQRSVKEISYDLGFESVYYFCRLFKKKTGFTPSQVRCDAYYSSAN